MIEITNEDNMKMMKRYPDNHFELAIVDPPYGIGFGEFNRTNKDSSGKRFKANKYKQSNWDDEIPNVEFFNELKRVAKNQIIWGGIIFQYYGKTDARVLFFGIRAIQFQIFQMGN